MSSKSNIVLIGMPGSGKSTIGKRLAKRFGMSFLDGDTLIEHAANMPIQQVVNRRGLKWFGELEQKVLCELEITDTVISTGGSAVYSEAAMNHLGRAGHRLYLRISARTLLRRVDNHNSRGLYKYPGHHLLRLYADRVALYPKYADIIFDNDQPFTDVKASELFAICDQAFDPK